MIRPSPARPALLIASLLVAAGLGSAAAPAEAVTVVPFSIPLRIPKVLTGANITLTAKLADVQILPGAKTRMWTYNGIFPGPTIRRPTGQTTNVTLVNNLPPEDGELTLHNHGNHSTPENDGPPDDRLAASGGSVTYTYTGTEDGGNERGAMQWYHDHRMAVTGRNVWMGLAGMYIIDDPADPQTLPKGAYEVPLMLTDRTFDANNQIAYHPNGNIGLMGNRTLVNGVPQPYFNVADRRYRLRILNASNARSYTLAMSNGQAFTQIGTDSGLLPAPIKRTQITIAPAERVDLVIDFARKLGQKLVLQNVAADGSMRQLLQFRVTRHTTDPSVIPTKLRALPKLASTPAVARTFVFSRSRITGQWLINNQIFDPNRIDATPKLGTTETWTFKNGSSSNHVIHLHDVDQQLVSRNGVAAKPWERMKESWNLAIGETIVLKVRFTDYLGKYVFHCHILEHEDDAMMANFEVVP